MPAKALYNLQLRTSAHVYDLHGTPGHPLPLHYGRAELCATLEDLSGYKASWIERNWIRKIKLGKTHRFGDDMGIGMGAIQLVVTRVQ